jgi:hypothetical protein
MIQERPVSRFCKRDENYNKTLHIDEICRDRHTMYRISLYPTMKFGMNRSGT